MAHDHVEDRQSYYLEQICTVALAGALGGVAIMMYRNSGLFFLANMFRQPVFWAGIVLLVLVAVRAVTLWVAVGKPVAAAAHEHDHDSPCGHDHGAACGEDHAHSHGAAPVAAHSHSHSHSHAHSHGHSHGGDDHGHDHGWNPWRFAILLLPVILFFMNLPNKGFGTGYLQRLAGGEVGDLGAATSTYYAPAVGLRLAADHSSEGSLPTVEFVEPESPAETAKIKVGDRLTKLIPVKDNDTTTTPEPIALAGMPLDKVIDLLKGDAGTQVKIEAERDGEAKPIDFTLTRADKVVSLAFTELEDAAFLPKKRQHWNGRRVRLKGQYMPGSNDKTFSLVRFKMTCCGADLRPLKVVMEAPESVRDVQQMEWLSVEGQIQFRERVDRKNEFVTVLKIPSLDKIRPAQPDSDPYIQ